MNKILNGSSVAIREVVICIKSAASRNDPIKDKSFRLNNNFKIPNNTGNMSTPAIAPGNRQAKGFIPNKRMDSAIILVPSNG